MVLSNDPELLNEIKSKVDEILYKNTEEILEDENNETDEVQMYLNDMAKLYQ